MNVTEAFRSHLLNNPTLSSLVDGWKVFADRIPQNATAPMIVYGIITSIPNDCLTGPLLSDESRFQVDCYGVNRVEADNLYLVTRDVLAGTRAEVGGVYMRITQGSGLIQMVDRPEGGDNQYRYISTGDFSVFYNSNLIA